MPTPHQLRQRFLNATESARYASQHAFNGNSMADHRAAQAAHTKAAQAATLHGDHAAAAMHTQKAARHAQIIHIEHQTGDVSALGAHEALELHGHMHPPSGPKPRANKAAKSAKPHAAPRTHAAAVQQQTQPKVMMKGKKGGTYYISATGQKVYGKKG